MGAYRVMVAQAMKRLRLRATRLPMFPFTATGRPTSATPSRGELLALRAYVKTGTYAKAAARLGISYSTLMGQLKHLYERTGSSSIQAAYRLGRGDWQKETR